MKQEQFLSVMDREEAHARFRAALGDTGPLGVEEVPLVDALGRVLSADIPSPVDVPGFDRSNVDGWAVQAADTFGASETSPKRLHRCDQGVRMGHLPAVELTSGTAMPIPTGGVVPRGADAVVMVEDTRLDAGEVLVTRAVTPGRNTTFAGTDVAQNEVVLRRRDVLTSRETGVLAAIGLSRVTVFVRPRVAILSTGDELVVPGAPLRTGQVYDSNAAILADAVRECGGIPLNLGIVPDDVAAVRAALEAALGAADVVLLSGGTSKGPHDLNVQALAAVLRPPGVIVHGVALKPGKPLCLAVSGRTPVVVLPGFPTSAIFTFHEFVAPVIRALAGRDEHDVEKLRARLPLRLNSEAGRTEYVLVRLTEDDQGMLVAYPVGKGSGSVTSWSHADGYFVIPAAVELVESGEQVAVLALAGERARRCDLVVIGSHCVGLDVMVGRLRQRGFSCKVIAVGSQGGLDAALRGECDIAGAHLFDAASGTYNQPFVRPGLVLRRGYGRLQGVLHRRGDARFEGKSAEDAVCSASRAADVIMINRNRGSGTRALYDRLLRDAKPPGHAVEASSHHAVAAAVAQGRADFGIAIDIVASDHDLGFLPIAEERYDFFVREARLGRPAVRAFLEELESPVTRGLLSARGLRA